MDSSFILMMIGTTVLGFIGYLITTAFVKAPGTALNRKFASLGVLKGKSYSEIKVKVGVENSISKKY